MNEEIGRLDEVRISILAEDTIEFDTPFTTRFGFSALLELKAGDAEAQILFDTNSSAEPIFRNLKILEKSLDNVSAIFLSHCHYDHTDGLPGVLEALEGPVPVIAHPESFRPCFEINPDGIRQIGIVRYTEDELVEMGAEFTLTREPLKVLDGVMTTGEVARRTSFEILEELYTIKDGETVQDHEKDDSALLLNLDQGLVIITGCCHAGIVNTMIHAREITGVDKIYAVVGGLHLIDANDEKLEKSVAALRELEWVFAGHCTGFKGLCRIAELKGDRFAQIHTGSEMIFPVADHAKPVWTIPTKTRDMHRL